MHTRRRSIGPTGGGTGRTWGRIPTNVDRKAEEEEAEKEYAGAGKEDNESVEVAAESVETEEGSGD